MKKFSKILSVALLVAMVLSLGIASAFAEETTAATSTITVENTNNRVSIEGKTYNAYKIFDAVYGTGNAVSYTIQADSYYYTNTAAKGVLDTYFDFTPSANDADTIVVTVKKDANQQEIAVDARALADALTDKVPSAPDGTANGGSNQKAEISVPGPGYYLVTGVIASVADPSRTVETAVALVPVNETATLNPKADIPDLTKQITAVKEDGTAIPEDLLDAAGKAAVAKVGSVVEYKLTSTVPDLTGYDDYTYTFTDAMDSGITYNDDAKVYIGGSETALDASLVNYTKNTNGFTLTLPFTTLETLTPGQSVEVKYSATVNASALTYNYEKNTATLTYSVNPGGDQTDHTPEQNTYVIDINVDVNKYAVDPTTGAKLADAQFKLFKGTVREGNVFYKWDETNGKVTWVPEADAEVFTTDSEGKLDKQIKGLDQGTYSLLETVAPSGFNLLSAPVEITISVSEKDGKVTYTSDPGTVTGGVIDLSADHTAQPVDTIDVLNQSGTQLPSTGGIGTTIFYVVGGVLVLAAIILLVTKKRMSE